MSTKITLDVHFIPGNRNHRELRTGKMPSPGKSEQLPRVTRLMALAEGHVQSHTELAELAGVDRSQISTLLRFRLLAPDIQEWLLNLSPAKKPRDPISMIDLRTIAAHPSWETQRRILHQHVPDLYTQGITSNESGNAVERTEASALTTAHAPL